MKLIKLFGMSVLVLGLAACGEPESGSSAESAAETAVSEAGTATGDAMDSAKEAATGAVEAVEEAVEEVVEKHNPEPIKLEPPEGMVEGSVEHTMWLLEQQDAH